ncbi:unnamed protein product [Protopolystoma xenopodis]|uniref:phosphopyruvate hydratase n=1 Tax=Protopolystoma xenopodis TaxID=117903 RepID=A0A448XC82_9PLAT|nr:unnamed protein product [Protopolystoma xenopodis]
MILSQAHLSKPRLLVSSSDDTHHMTTGAQHEVVFAQTCNHRSKHIHPHRLQVVGDDLLVTNAKRVSRAIETGACNALLLKVNQIGTFTEALEACQLARQAGWRVMVSHRSGETEDNTIADIAVGLACGQVSLPAHSLTSSQMPMS